MNSPELQRQIAALTTALADADTVDEATRSSLTALQSQIARLVGHEGSIARRLEQLAVRFETDHPAAGTALRQAIDALGKAGI